MLNKRELESQLKNEITEKGCIDIEQINNGELLTGYSINEKGSKEAKIVGTIEEKPNTGMQTDNPKKFTSYSKHVTSKENIKRTIVYLIESARRRGYVNKIKYVVNPISVRSYLFKNNKLEEWANLDIDSYNSLVDEIRSKLEINDKILEKIENQDELENIKKSLEILDPISMYYSKLIEDFIRKKPAQDGLIISTQNMTNVVNNFIKALNINDNFIELGSGAGCILREQDSTNNAIKGIEINKNISDISKLLNLISGRENIEIKESDALKIDETEKYGLAIVEPPIGVRVDSEQYKNNYIVARNSKMVNISDLFLEKAINITKDGGYIVAVVNDSLLFTKQSESIRKVIANKTIIKAIVSLPNHIQKPYTVVKMSIVIMKKKTTSLENCEKLFISEINKLDEINEVSNQFTKFIKHNLDETNNINYNVLYESDNWTVNYLKMFKELNSSNRYALNELCEINSKGIKRLINEKEKYPYIEVSNIDADKKILKDIKEVNYSELPSRAKLIAYPGDIVISTARPEKGAIAIVPDDNDVYIVSNAIAVLSTKNISAELLYFILGSEKVTQELASLASGTAVPMILMKQLKEYKIPMSDIPKQYEKEAKELYEKMMVKYTHHKTLNQIIEEELQKVDKIDAKEYKIEEVISYKRPVILKDEKEVKQVKIANLNSESLYVNDEELDIFEDKEGRHNLIKNKDILIPRVLDSIERTSVADTNIEGCISNQFIYSYSANDIVLPEYMAMLLRSSEVKEKLEALGVVTRGRTMLKRDGIQSMTIKLPTIEMQKNIVEDVLNKSKEYSLNEINIERSCFEGKLL